MKKKTKEKKSKLWQLVTQKWLEQIPSNLECRLPWLAGNSVATLDPIGSGITEIQRCENDVFFLPVNIPTVWRTSFLGRTTHYRVLILRVKKILCYTSMETGKVDIRPDVAWLTQVYYAHVQQQKGGRLWL